MARCVGGLAAALGMLLALVSSLPPPSCPPACAWDAHRKCCGVWSPSPDPEHAGTCQCPAGVLFSAGVDNDMVLQREPAKAAVYGALLEQEAVVEVTVTSDAASYTSYTVQAEVLPAPVWSGPAGANYSASWKAYLRPTPPGGNYRITVKCTERCGTGSGANATTRNEATIERATFGDVYFCSGQSNMALPLQHTFSAKQLQAEMMAGKYDNLRWFQFGGMSAPHNGHQNFPTWTQQSGSMTYVQFGSEESHSWFNSSFAAAVAPRCEHHHDMQPPCQGGEHIDVGPLQVSLLVQRLTVPVFLHHHH